MLKLIQFIYLPFTHKYYFKNVSLCTYLCKYILRKPKVTKMRKKQFSKKVIYHEG